MASTYKILGLTQGPGTLYTVPTGGQSVVSTIMVANLTTSDQVFTISVTDSGSSTSANIAYDTTVLANSSTAITAGITLNSGDSIAVSSTNPATVDFTAFGLEIN